MPKTTTNLGPCEVLPSKTDVFCQSHHVIGTLQNSINVCLSRYKGVKVPARSLSQWIQAKGIYKGAKVARGPDWTADYDEQDGKNIF